MKEMKELLTDGINHKNNTHRELLSKQIKGVLNLKPTKITRKFPIDKAVSLSDVNNFELNNRQKHNLKTSPRFQSFIQFP